MSSNMQGKSYDSGYGSGRNGSSYGGSYGGSGYGGGYGGGGGWGQAGDIGAHHGGWGDANRVPGEYVTVGRFIFVSTYQPETTDLVQFSLQESNFNGQNFCDPYQFHVALAC